MGQYREERYKGWKRRNAPYLIAACLALVMVLLGGPEVMDGESMSPTINDGDLLIVSKHDYSEKRGRIPDRDKIVILEKARSMDVADDNIITRVIGLPGETIEIKDGQVFIDGKRHTMEGGIRGAAGGDIKVKLKKGHVFVMGDNREISEYDSRNEDLGVINMKDDIKGNVLLRVWPIGEFGTIE